MKNTAICIRNKVCKSQKTSFNFSNAQIVLYESNCFNTALYLHIIF